MKFLDRKDELARLNRLSDAQEGGFVALWGRRRIGKSELLKRWCGEADGIYTVADRSSAAVQRMNFALALSSRFEGFDTVVYPTWKALFDALSRRAAESGWHRPLVIDEFPYWVEADESILSVMQNWIDAEKRRKGILIAIAGSSQHMMQGIVINQDSPLYGRTDERMKLAPLGFEYIGEALGLSNPVDCIKAYAIWGGVPRYWVAAERYRASLDDAVDDQILSPLGIFHDEPSTLLQSEIPSALSLKPYLDVIGSGVNRVSEIAGRTGVTSTTLSKPLSRLVDLGLVKREIPYGENEKSSKKSLYKIADPFCRFWFDIVAPRRSLFESAPASLRKSLWRKYASRLYAAEWEELARRSVVTSKRLARLSGKNDFWMPAGRWWQGEAHELDVVSVNGSRTKTLIGEVKWSERPFTRKEVASLATKFATIAPPPGLPHDVVRALFLPAVAPGVESVVNNIAIITPDATPPFAQ